MTQKAKDIVISTGFGISAVLCITSEIPLIRHISFLAFIVLVVIWVNKTTWGQKTYEAFLNSIGGDEEIEDFDYSDEE